MEHQMEAKKAVSEAITATSRENTDNTYQDDENQESYTSSAQTASEGNGAPRQQHHLTRHWLEEQGKGEAALAKLGATDAKHADKIIRSLGQRELRAAFEKVYGSATRSFNNHWLRRKLAEAVGLPRGSGKKAKVATKAAKVAKRERSEETRKRNIEAEEEAAHALASLMG